jgi:hypothetical protein
MESQYFEHLAEYEVAVCKECRYAVWPDQIEGHLQEQHKIRLREASAEGEAIRSWAGVIQYPSQLKLPSRVPKPVTQLPLHADGLLCQLNLDSCQYIARSRESIRKHWRECHGWSAGKKRGRPSRTERKRVQAQVEEGYKQVYCQRLFSSRHGAQYFQVQQPDNNGPDVVLVNRDAAWAQVGKQMAKAWANVKTRAQNTIQEGERDEVNPWLERTQWLPYLVGMDRPQLLACIEEPVTESNPRQEQQAEPVEAAMWVAMEGLARFSQASVIHCVGLFVRFEAIRTEKHQTRFQPLQPYMNEKSISEHARPWQQMLMFFARTQREHAWKSPKYRFTRQQREAWEALVKEAKRSAQREEEEQGANDEEMEDEEREDKEMENEEMANDVDKAIEEIEKEGNRTAEGISKPESLSNIQKACLTFCIALLSQSITRKEYDSPMVCALAVLGMKEDGWKGPEQDSPILSDIIKVARFMLVSRR